MLRLVDEPSVNTSLLPLFKCSYPVSTAVPSAVLWRSHTCCNTCV